MNVLNTLKFLLLLASLFSSFALGAQCDPDIESPTLVCDADVPVNLQGVGAFYLDVSTLVEDAYDNCDADLDLSYSIDGGISYTTGLLSLDCDDLGVQTIWLQVSDDAGNTNICFVNITVESPSLPSLACNDQVVVALSADGETDLGLDAILEGSYEVCSTSDLEFSYTLDNGPAVFEDIVPLNCADVGEHIVAIIVTDESGNSNACWSTVTVVDKLNPWMSCLDSVEVELNEDGLVNVLPEILIDTIFDNCASEGLQYDLSIAGIISGSSLELNCDFVGENLINILVEDLSGNSASCQTYIVVTDPLATCEVIEVSGNVFFDSNQNCTLDDSEGGPEGWEVGLRQPNSGVVRHFFTDATGKYTASLYSNTTTDANLELFLPFAAGNIQPCGSTYTLDIPANNSIESADFPVFLQEDCPLLAVDIATDRLRFCSEATYHVNYCNYSNLLVENSFLEITLDEGQSFVSAELPVSSINGHTYSFDLGDIPSARCNSFSLTVETSCTGILGQTECIEAHIYPAVICDEVDPLWTGASIDVEAICEDDEVRFEIQNIGTGSMADELQFLIVEDVVMYMSDTFEVDPQEIFNITVPANGSTWRLEAQQEPGHPGMFQPVAWMEGCGGLNTPGQINLFPTNKNDYFRSVFCLETSGAYDPNDKQGFPLGLTDEHLIRPNESLDYLIRFQNTGTDTAFLVIIRDTLDQDLVPTSVRPGSSSHPYTFEALGDGIIQFTFDNIMLPDSNVNEAASHGFVRFKIDQLPDLPMGTQITNEAAIYFDFNAPVITNQTLHTIEENMISSTINTDIFPSAEIIVAPNPFRESVEFDLKGLTTANGLIRLYDSTGRLIKSMTFDQNKFSIQEALTNPGVYFYEIILENQWLASGKLIKE
jgi:uncharacterized repeat protein (TIGR01451 family)